MIGPRFHCIGVDADRPEEMVRFVNRALERAQGWDINDGGESYLAEDPSSGALVAVNITGDGTIQCVKPSFAAASTLRAVPRGFAADRECRFCDRLSLEVIDDNGEMIYPLAIELHDIAAHRDGIPLNKVVDARVVGFAEELTVWADEDAYLGDQDPEIRYGPESLIPTGLFVDEGAPVTAHALLTGRVVAGEEKVNGWTGGSFRWARVGTYGGEYEIVAPIEAPDLPEGHIAQAHVWFIGAVISP